MLEGRAAHVRRASLTWALSICVHGVIIGAVTLVAVANLRKQHEQDAERAREMAAREPIAIELPLAFDGETISRVKVDHTGVVPVVAGGATDERLDTGRAGHGGDRISHHATHLSDRDERLNFTPDTVSHL